MQSGDALQVLAVAEQFARSARLLSARPLRLGVRRTRTVVSRGGAREEEEEEEGHGPAGLDQHNGEMGRAGLAVHEFRSGPLAVQASNPALGVHAGGRLVLLLSPSTDSSSAPSLSSLSSSSAAADTDDGSVLAAVPEVSQLLLRSPLLAPDTILRIDPWSLQVVGTIARTEIIVTTYYQLLIRESLFRTVNSKTRLAQPIIIKTTDSSQVEKSRYISEFLGKS
eukprot:g29553.t1